MTVTLFYVSSVIYENVGASSVLNKWFFFSVLCVSVISLFKRFSDLNVLLYCFIIMEIETYIIPKGSTMYLVTLNTGKLLFPTHVEAIIAYSILGEFRKHDEIYALRAVRDIIFEQLNGS